MIVAIPFIALLIISMLCFFIMIGLDNRPLTEDEIEEQVAYLKEWREKQEAKKMILKKDGTNQETMIDIVNHPSHYETGKFECIDVMLEVFGKEKVMAFCQLNAFKYLYRSDRKNGVEDMQKAEWYLNKYRKLAGD